MANYPPNLAKRGAYATAAAAFASGAAPKTIAGKAVPLADVAAGTLSARCTVNARTNTTTITAKWQVSNDNSTWLDIRSSTNAAQVALVTGTGSDVAADVILDAPGSIVGWRYARVLFTTGTGTADGTNDTAGSSYNYRQFAG